MFGMVTRQSAELENNMNSVERVVQYSRGDLIEQEPDHDIDDKKPPPSWPDKGTIEFDDVVMRYRPGLPPVLKGVREITVWIASILTGLKCRYRCRYRREKRLVLSVVQALESPL